MNADWRWQAALVSVVVPTYNRAATLARVLEAFATQTLPAERFEVLVIDDGSTDATPQVVAAAAGRLPYALSLHQQANQGPAAARNRGLRAARGEVVVFIDDDCVPTPGLLAAHRAAHEVEGVAAIGRIVWHPDLSITPFMRVLEAETFAYTNIGVPFDTSFFCYYTGNASVHRASALAIDGFDQSFPHWHEDIEFAFRLRGHGVRFVFASDAVVQHLRHVDVLGTLQAQEYKGRELMRLFAKHPELRGYLPIERLADPSIQDAAYAAVLHQALLAGVGDGIDALAESDPLRERLALEQSRWVDRRVDELQAEIAQLHRDLEQVQREAQEAERLQHEHARLERAYQALSQWCAELEQQAAARQWSRRVGGSTHSATNTLNAGLRALLAFRRGKRNEPPQ